MRKKEKEKEREKKTHKNINKSSINRSILSLQKKKKLKNFWVKDIMKIKNETNK
jgi:hypothetical protein